MNIRKVIVGLVIFTYMLFVGCVEKSNYNGNGVLYLNTNGKSVILNNFNIDTNEVYSDKIGSRDDYFWALINLYDKESIMVLNDDTFYIANENNIKIYNDIADRIVAINKVNNYYIIISQYENEYIINIFNNDFKTNIFNTNIEGIYNGMYEKNEYIYISSYSNKNNKSSVYKFNINNNEVVKIFEVNEVISMLPYVSDNQLYVIKQRKIDENTGQSECINKLEKVIGSKESIEIMEFDDDIKKIIDFDGKTYILGGLNFIKLYESETLDRDLKLVYESHEEAANSIYSINEKLILISNKGIYEVGSKVIKLADIETDVENEYQ